MLAETETVASKLCIETESKPKQTTAVARALLLIRIQKSWTYDDDTLMLVIWTQNSQNVQIICADVQVHMNMLAY